MAKSDRAFGVNGQKYFIAYRCVKSTNLHGPGDNYHPENSHVIPALIRRFHEAKESNAPLVSIWGTGTPRREFLYVDDMAEACVHVMNLDYKIYSANTQPMLSHINVGYGTDLSIFEAARLVAKTVGYEGDVVTDPSRPDGTPRKLMDSTRLYALGWTPKTNLMDGLALTYQNFLETHTND
jgi:GDP-L-fucose synthase